MRHNPQQRQTAPLTRPHQVTSRTTRPSAGLSSSAGSVITNPASEHQCPCLRPGIWHDAKGPDVGRGSRLRPWQLKPCPFQFPPLVPLACTLQASVEAKAVDESRSGLEAIISPPFVAWSIDTISPSTLDLPGRARAWPSRAQLGAAAIC